MVRKVVVWPWVASACAAPWRFGVISDTQWKDSPDAKNPNAVAVNVINHLNEQFIAQGVKFVVAVGDISQNGDVPGLDTSATFRQALYNAGIGFYPLRGNHESSKTAAGEFQRIFPQTQTGVNNQTPADALFGNDPSANPDGLQDLFMANRFDNGVRYYMGGHDHMHNRAIITSPDGSSMVQNIITVSDSYKFLIPQVPPTTTTTTFRPTGSSTGPVRWRVPRSSSPSATLS